MRASFSALARALLTLSLLCGACEGIPFDVGQDLMPEQHVPGNPLSDLPLASFVEVPFPLNIDLRAETGKRNTGPARSAQLKLLTLIATPKDMPSGNFDFLDEVHIYVAPRGGGSLPKVEIARLVPVPKGQTTVQFTIVPNVDLLPYINAGAEITASASGKQPKRDFSYGGRIEITIRI